VTEAKAIDVGTPYTSERLRLKDGKRDYSVQYEVSGSGSLDVQTLTSIDGRSFVINRDVLKRIKSNSGPASDGKDIVVFSVKLAEFIRFKFTASTATVTVTLWFTQK